MKSNIESGIYILVTASYQKVFLCTKTMGVYGGAAFEEFISAAGNGERNSHRLKHIFSSYIKKFVGKWLQALVH